MAEPTDETLATVMQIITGPSLDIAAATTDALERALAREALVRDRIRWTIEGLPKWPTAAEYEAALESIERSLHPSPAMVNARVEVERKRRGA